MSWSKLRWNVALTRQSQPDFGTWHLEDSHCQILAVALRQKLLFDHLAVPFWQELLLAYRALVEPEVEPDEAKNASSGIEAVNPESYGERVLVQKLYGNEVCLTA